MKHTKTNCERQNLILAGKCGLQCANCLACKCGKCNEDRPEYGKQYRLTGGYGEKAISNGNTWAESEVKCPVCDKPFKDSRTCPECDKLVDSL